MRLTLNRRRGVLALLGVALLGSVTAALLLPTAPGDPAPRAAAQARETFAEQVAPTLDTTSTMVVPATGDWWRVATGFAAPLDLAGTELPDDARWVAYSTARTRNPQARELMSYPALYLGFDTARQADAWNAPESCTCQTLTRGNVVTILYVTADPAAEPLPELDHVDPDQVTTTSGAWQVNITDLVDDLTAHNPNRRHQLAMFAALGVDTAAEGDVIWTATADRPTGPWTGTVTGLDTAAIDLLEVGKAIGDTVVDDCTKAGCETTSLGIFELLDTMYLRHGDWEYGNPDLADPDAVTEPLGADVLRGAIDLSRWEGTFTGYGTVHYSDITGVRFTLDRNDTLTMNLTLAEQDQP